MPKQRQNLCNVLGSGDYGYGLSAMQALPGYGAIKAGCLQTTVTLQSPIPALISLVDPMIVAGLALDCCEEEKTLPQR